MSKTKKVSIVLGSLFGDEGKGNTVQWLCKKALADGKKPLVIRFSGGAQAGHRVINEKNEHVCSLTGSGVLLNVPTYLNQNVYIDPISLKREYEILVYKGFTPKLYINNSCRVVTLYDILKDSKDKKVQSHGTTGCGIHATFVRYRTQNVVETLGIGDTCLDPEYMLETVESYYSDDKITISNEDKQKFIDACNWLKQFVIREDEDPTELYDTLIFEGSQGLLLDMENGFMPHCTPSMVGLNGIPVKFLDNAMVYLVMRSYLTRHGNGYDPENEKIVRTHYQNLFEATNRDDGPQGLFKVGVHEHKLIRDAFTRHKLDNYVRMYNCIFNLVITHMDCCPGFKTSRELVPPMLFKDEERNKVLMEYPNAIMNDMMTSVGIMPENIYLGYGPDSCIVNCPVMNNGIL